MAAAVTPEEARRLTDIELARRYMEALFREGDASEYMTLRTEIQHRYQPDEWATNIIRRQK